MAYSNRQRSKARRLYEFDGISLESIADIIGCSRKAMEAWQDKDEAAGDPWVKGKYSQQLREKEEAAKVKAIEDAGYNKGRIIAELGAVAFSNLSQMVKVDKDGSVQALPLDQLGEAVKAVKGIKQRKVTHTDKEGKTTTEVQLEYVTHDKLGSLTLLGKEAGMFKDGSEQQAPLILNLYRERMRERRGKKP